MKELEIYPSFERVERTVYIADSPIDFATWLDLSRTIDSELVQGVILHKMAAQYPHEWIFMWLASVLSTYVQHRKLGKVLGSRSAVKISNIGGRLPDLLFVRAENDAIIKPDAIYGAPDLVIEIVSENDRPSDLIPLEADYRSIGVGEIVFLDPRKKRVRYLRNTGTDYDEAYLTGGELRFLCVPGFAVDVEWLWRDDKPDSLETVLQLIKAAEAGTA